MCVGAEKGGRMAKRKIKSADDIKEDFACTDKKEFARKFTLLKLKEVSKRKNGLTAPPPEVIKNAG